MPDREWVSVGVFRLRSLKIMHPVLEVLEITKIQGTQTRWRQVRNDEFTFEQRFLLKVDT